MQNAQQQVSVIGLGAMGSALARTLLSAGYRVTVWNRSSEKAEPLVAEGAVLAPSAAGAVAASPVVLICVATYEATRAVLGNAEAQPALKGRTIVELGSGTPDDARASEAWAREVGVDYLDGAIMATPSQIGRRDTTIFFSGSETAFGASRSALEALAGRAVYMGPQVSLASTWDLGVLSCLFGALLGFFHGARIFESESLKVSDLGAAIAEIAPAIGEMIKESGDVIPSGLYENAQSSVKTCALGSELFVKQAREAKINDEFPTFSAGLFNKAVNAGFGAQEAAAVVKVLRG